MKRMHTKPNWLDHRAFGLFLATTASVIFSRAMIWITDENALADYGIWELASIIIGSCLEDLAVAVILFGFYAITTQLNFGSNTYRTVKNNNYRLSANIIYTAFSLILIVACALNALSIVRMGFPVSTGWWPYLNADYLMTLRTSMETVVTPRSILFLLGAIVLIPGGAYTCWFILRRGRWLASLRFISVCASVFFVSSMATYNFAAATSEHRVITPPRIAINELFLYGGNLSDVTEFTSDEDWLVESSRLPSTVVTPKKFDIIYIVIDSVGARYIDPSSPQYHLADTPNIDRLRETGLFFTNIYAHTPNSSKQHLTMETSHYPTFSPEFDTDKLRRMQVPTLSKQLQQAGYATSHFMTGDIRLGGVYDYLSEQGYDYIGESSDFSCSYISRRQHQYYGHKGDRCTTDAALQWLSKANMEKPVFSWIWYNNPHYPYYHDGRMKAFDNSRNEQEFLKALSATDKEIGRLVAYVEAQGLLNDTFIILTSDHGESFGERGNYIHGTSVYEEETNVPLIISNPVLFSGSISRRVGGAVDIPPTILDLAQFPSKPAWQGHSLFDEAKPERVYFYSMISNVMIGYRDGNRKYVLRSDTGDIVSFDLQRDKLEHRPIVLAGKRKDQVKSRIASWVRYQEKISDVSADD